VEVRGWATSPPHSEHMSERQDGFPAFSRRQVRQQHAVRGDGAGQPPARPAFRCGRPSALRCCTGQLACTCSRTTGFLPRTRCRHDRRLSHAGERVRRPTVPWRLQAPAAIQSHLRCAAAVHMHAGIATLPCAPLEEATLCVLACGRAILGSGSMAAGRTGRWGLQHRGSVAPTAMHPRQCRFFATSGSRGP
jgi:hypothetical protein